MRIANNNSAIILKILESSDEMISIEDLQRVIWPGNETEVVPGHLLLTAAHNGGLVIAAYSTENRSLRKHSNPTVNRHLEEDLTKAQPVGFVFGFPGIYETADGPRLKHCSHMLGVIPEARDQGIGFLLKRAQWQIVRQQGIDRITWTYDPLLSRNAHLNIRRLGAVSNTYINNAYGDMRDDLNAGLPSDRLQVDWWVNTTRVTRRLSRKARPPLRLEQYLAAGADIIEVHYNNNERIEPSFPHPKIARLRDGEQKPLILLEIPANFHSIRDNNPDLAQSLRLQLRTLFHELFRLDYIITDFIILPSDETRCFYVLTHGEATL